MVACQQFLVEYIRILVRTNASVAHQRSDHEPLHTILSKISAFRKLNKHEKKSCFAFANSIFFQRI